MKNISQTVYRILQFPEQNSVVPPCSEGAKQSLVESAKATVLGNVEIRKLLAGVDRYSTEVTEALESESLVAPPKKECDKFQLSTTAINHSKDQRLVRSEPTNCRQPFPLRVELATFLNYICCSKDGITCGGTKYFTHWHLVSLSCMRAKS